MEYAKIGEDQMIHIVEGNKDTIGLKSLQDNYRYVQKSIYYLFIQNFISNNLIKNPFFFIQDSRRILPASRGA